MPRQVADVIIDDAVLMATNDAFVVAFLGVLLGRHLSLTVSQAIATRMDQ